VHLPATRGYLHAPYQHCPTCIAYPRPHLPRLLLGYQAMFSFHKSDASRSRQSSVDSQATGHTTYTAAADLWSDQCTEYQSHGGIPSPELHNRNPARRSSVFNLRSRSNTATSVNPSLLSLTQHDMAEHDATWHGSPPARRHTGNKSLKESASRKSLFRGKKGKRLSETSQIVVDDCEGDATERRTSILRRARRGTNQSEDTCKWSVANSLLLIAHFVTRWKPYQPHLEPVRFPAPLSHRPASICCPRTGCQ